MGPPRGERTKDAAKASRKAREAERTRADIARAAARVVAREGYHGATMSAIAREAGFTAASLYTYFQSKDEIVEALLAGVLGSIFATFDAPIPEGLAFPQRLELLLSRQLRVVAEHQAELLALFGELPAKVRRDARPGPRDFLDRLAAWLEASGAGEALRIPAREAAAVLFGILDSVSIRWLVLEGVPLDPADARRVVDLFLHGAGRAPAQG